MRDSGAPVEPLAAPVPEDEDGAFYRADLLLAPGAQETGPEQLRGARVAFNGDDSLSGWVMPRQALRELGIDPDGYDWVQTGSHRNSLRALLRDEVEAAPIDSTVLALELRADPALAALRRIARLGHMPSPPVTLVGGDAGLAATLRAALTALEDSEQGRAALGLGAVRALRGRGRRGLRAGAGGGRHALRLPAVAAQARDHAHALEGDRRAHLRLAGRAVAEGERHLDDAQTGAVRALRRLDLEDVALRARGGDVDRCERRWLARA